ncbi:hypothetical protein, partial [uncultured Dialister sp.]|uniref:hypothetical protein n=1 Tax=uncultured Dialister sp. TaxID=278064 RepID=UPI00265EABF7
ENQPGSNHDVLLPREFIFHYTSGGGKSIKKSRENDGSFHSSFFVLHLLSGSKSFIVRYGN